MAVDKAVDMANMAGSLSAQMGGVADLLGAMGYLGGIAFGMMAALAFKEHNESGGRVPLSKAVTMAVVAACMLALPDMLKMSMDTLGAPQTASVASGSGSGTRTGRLGDSAAVDAKAAAAKQQADADKVAIAIADAAGKKHAKDVAAKTDPVQDLASTQIALVPDSVPVAVKVKPAAKETQAVDSDIRALLEVLVGFGLVGVGGWTLVLRATRKSKASEASKIDLAIARSTDLAEQSQQAPGGVER